MMTAFYMFRLYATTFRGSFRGTEEQKHHLHESPAAMTIPLIVLAILSAVGGLIGIPEVISPGSHKLEQFLAPIFEQSKHIKESVREAAPLGHSTEMNLMLVSVVGALIFIIFAWARYSKKPELNEPTGFGKVLADKWYIDELYNFIIVRPLQWLAKFLNNIVEKNIIDWLVNGVGRIVNYASRQVRLLQSGLVGNYVLLMVLGMLALFVIKFFLKK
jgi:NADH-quinone oxidoreductase subunit L